MIHKNMTFEEYQRIPAVNFSTLKWCEVSVSQMRLRQQLGGQDTPALKFGRAVHTAILEPEIFAETYKVIGDKRKKETKAEIADAEFFSMETLTEAEGKMLDGMKRGVESHTQASYLLAHADKELVCVWTDEKTGVACKARIDAYVPTMYTLVDLKSTKDDFDARFFHSTIVEHFYHVQLAFYARGLRANDRAVEHLLQLFTSKAEPYASELIRLDDELLAHAELMIDEWLAAYASDEQIGITTVKTPNWYKEKYLKNITTTSQDYANDAIKQLGEL